MTGGALQKLEGRSSRASSVAVSHDGNIAYTLLTSNNWAAKGGSNLLWLPPAYRATCEALWKEVIVLGHSSGKVSILGFKEGSRLI